MGVVTMAYTHYPTFFGELWRGLRPLCRSRPFIEACMDLRAYAELRAAELGPGSLIEPLNALGYAQREIDAIRQMNTVFSHGNQLYVMIATVARHLLEVGDMKGKTDADIFEGRHAPEIHVPLVLMEPHHADEPTRAVYRDISWRRYNHPMLYQTDEVIESLSYLCEATFGDNDNRLSFKSALHRCFGPDSIRKPRLLTFLPTVC